jgi:replicative DNA helicase
MRDLLQTSSDKTFSELHATFGASQPLKEPVLSVNAKRCWEMPLLFDDIETPDIPVTLLPPPFQAFAAALADATETASALVVMVIVGVLSVAANKKFRVSPKPGWEEPVNIYTLIGLPPANNKSLVLKQCIQPLIEWEQAQTELQAEDIKRQQSEWKTQMQLIESLRKKVGRQKDKMARQCLMDEITALETQLTEPAVLPNLFANNVTPEALARLTFQQGGHFAVISDEGGAIETLSGLYSHGQANVDILLKGIDGGDFRISRKDYAFTLNPLLTLLLVIQPAVMQKMAMKYAFCDNGLLERFLYVLPKSNLGYRTHNAPAVSPALQAAFNQQVKNLLNLPLPKQTTPLLTLSPTAFTCWHDFQASIEMQLRPNGDLAVCQGWGGKLAGFTLRIAALLHIAEYRDERFIISDKTMQAAVTLAGLLKAHAIAAYSMMGGEQSTEDAKEIFKWIQAQAKPTFTQSDLRYALRNRNINQGDRIAKATAILLARHIIQAERLPTQKPTTLFHVHPQLIKEDHA